MGHDPGEFHAPLSAGPVLIATVAWIIAFAGHAPSAHASRSFGDTLVVPTGKAIKVDGVLSDGEWSDADTLQIRAGPEWHVQILVKHDDKALYVAFSNLVHRKAERYPEILMDVAGDGGSAWRADDWWFHASYHDCTGQSAYDIYKLQACSEPHGWYANNFPLAPGQAVEFRISLGLVGLRTREGASERVFRMAFDLTDSVTDPPELRRYWPLSATIREPGTWSRARMAPASSGTGRSR